MKFIVAAVIVLMCSHALADDAKAPLAKTPVCTSPDQLVIKLPFTKAVVLNNILQDVDVTHREWRDVATDVRAQLVGQCKETQK